MNPEPKKIKPWPGRKYRLYHYISLTAATKTKKTKNHNKLLGSLLHPCLYTTDPANCNDPFEFKVCASDPDQPRNARWYAGQKVRAELLASSRIICLTKRPDDALMWSHYSASHTGVVLEYRSDLLEYLAGCGGISIGPVYYTRELPKVTCKDELSQRLMRSLYFTKAKVWAHEKEVRVVLHNCNDELIKLPQGMITAVIFGAKSSLELRQMLWAKFKNSRTIKLKQAVLGWRDYSVMILPYDQNIVYF